MAVILDFKDWQKKPDIW